MSTSLIVRKLLGSSNEFTSVLCIGSSDMPWTVARLQLSDSSKRGSKFACKFKTSGIITGFDVAILTFNWRNYARHL